MLLPEDNLRVVGAAVSQRVANAHSSGGSGNPAGTHPPSGTWTLLSTPKNPEFASGLTSLTSTCSFIYGVASEESAGLGSSPYAVVSPLRSYIYIRCLHQSHIQSNICFLGRDYSIDKEGSF